MKSSVHFYNLLLTFNIGISLHIILFSWLSIKRVIYVILVFNGLNELAMYICCSEACVCVPLASYYLASFFEARGETLLDLNSLRYIFRGSRYWIPPDNSALNHLGAGGCRIGKGPLISRWVSTGSWIMQGPAKGWSSREACVDVTLLGLSVNRIPPLGKRLFETFRNTDQPIINSRDWSRILNA